MIYYKTPGLIKKSGIPHRELAKRLGLAYRTISRMAHAMSLKDKDTSGQTYEMCADGINRLCAFFKCKPGDLLTFKPERGDLREKPKNKRKKKKQ